MKRFALLLLTLAPTLALGAEDEGVFISLTRSAAPDRRLPTNVDVITAEDLQALGARTLDDALLMIPSAQVQKTGGLGSFSTLRLRGSPSSAHVQVLIDDVPLGGVSTQFVDLSLVPLDGVERIEIIRGGSSVLYGANTLGGVVNVITRRHQGDKATSSLTAEGRSFFGQVYQGDMSGRSGRWDGRMTASRSLSDGFQGNSDADQISASGYGAYSWENGARLTADLARVSSKVGDPGGTLVPIQDWDGRKERTPLQLNQRVKNGSTRGRLEAALPLGEKAFWETTLFAFDQDFDFVSEFGASFDTQRKNIILGGDTRLRRGGTTLGLALERDQRRVEDGHAGFFRRDHIVNTGAYLQQTLSWGALTLLPAVRWDNHSYFGDTINPRLAVVCAVSEEWKASAGAARAFRAPDMVSLFDTFPGDGFFFGDFLANPDLRPETAVTYDAGVERRGTAGSFSVTGFHTRLKDRIYSTQNPFPASNTTANGPRAELSGAEMESAHRWGPVSLQAAYTYLRAIGNRASDVRYVTLRLSPRHQARLRLTLSAPRGWVLANEVRCVDRQYTNENQQGFTIPSHTLWGVRLSKRILSAEFFGRVENLTDKHYADTGSNFSLNPQPGRTLAGGVTVRFAD